MTLGKVRNNNNNSSSSNSSKIFYIYKHLKIHIIILLSDLDKVPLANWNDWALMGSSKDHFAGAKMEDYTESTFAIRVHWALTSQENKMFDCQGD